MVSQDLHTLISTHTLAPAIASADQQILDQDELALLSQFVADPSRRDELLQEHGFVRDDSADGQQRNGGSLVAFVMARHGTEKQVFSEGDVGMLRGWFGRK